MSLYLRGKKKSLMEFTDNRPASRIPMWKRILRVGARMILMVWEVAAVSLWIGGVAIWMGFMVTVIVYGTKFTHSLLDPFFPKFVAPYSEYFISGTIPVLLVIWVVFAAIEEFFPTPS